MKGKQKVPNIVRGGVAIPLGKNLYYLEGRTHEQGGIDIGSNPKTGIEAERGEIVQMKPDEIRILSAQPMLGGISPAEAVIRGVNPDKAFNAQERFKDVNRLNDDGSSYKCGGRKKAENGSNTKKDKSLFEAIDDYVDTVEVPLGLTGTGLTLGTLAIPNPVTAVAATAANIGGTIIDSYQTARSLYKKDYNNAVKNAIEAGLGLFGAKGVNKIFSKTPGVYYTPSKMVRTSKGWKRKGAEYKTITEDEAVSFNKKLNVASEASSGLLTTGSSSINTNNKKFYGGFVTINGNVKNGLLYTPRMACGGRKKADLGTKDKPNKFADLAIQAAIATDPSIAAAAGWEIDKDGYAVKKETEGSKQLAENLAILSTYSPTNPLNFLLDKAIKGYSFLSKKAIDYGEELGTGIGNFLNKSFNINPTTATDLARTSTDLARTKSGIYRTFTPPFYDVPIEALPGNKAITSGSVLTKTKTPKVRYQKALDKHVYELPETEAKAALSEAKKSLESGTNTSVAIIPSVTSANTSSSFPIISSTNLPAKNPNYLVKTDISPINTPNVGIPFIPLVSDNTTEVPSYSPITDNKNRAKDISKQRTVSNKNNFTLVPFPSYTPDYGEYSLIVNDDTSNSFTGGQGGTSSTSLVSPASSANTSKTTAGTVNPRKPASTPTSVEGANNKVNLYSYSLNPSSITIPSTTPISDLNADLQSYIDRNKVGYNTSVTIPSTINLPNVLDYIGLGANIVGNITSGLLTNKALAEVPLVGQTAAPASIPAAKLKTRYNINPQLSQIEDDTRRMFDEISRNTASSNVALARKQASMLAGQRAKNELYGTKENIETELYNKDALNRQQVAAQNVANYQKYLNNDMRRKMFNAQLEYENKLAKASNVNNMFSGIVSGVQDLINKLEQRRALDKTLAAIKFRNPNAPDITKKW